MILQGEYISIQNNLKNIALLTNGQNFFAEISKTSLWESVTLSVPFLACVWFQLF